MTDEERLHMITEQLIIVRDNLFRGMSKSIQKLQAKSINEVLGLDNFIQSPKPIWVGLTQQEVDECIDSNIRITNPQLRDAIIAVIVDIEMTLMEKNT